jgi:hypothetical protein
MPSYVQFDIWQNTAGATYNSVLNVYSANKSDTQALVGGTWADIVGLSITLTPRYNTSKFLILYSVTLGINGQYNQSSIRLQRGGSLIAVGDAAGSRERVTSGNQDGGGVHGATYCFAGTYLDSPTTASPITYNIQFRSEGAYTTWVNRGNEADGDNIVTQRCFSNLTILETAA